MHSVDWFHTLLDYLIQCIRFHIHQYEQRHSYVFLLIWPIYFYSRLDVLLWDYYLIQFSDDFDSMLFLFQVLIGDDHSCWEVRMKNFQRSIAFNFILENFYKIHYVITFPSSQTKCIASFEFSQGYLHQSDYFQCYWLLNQLPYFSFIADYQLS